MAVWDFCMCSSACKDQNIRSHQSGVSGSCGLLNCGHQLHLGLLQDQYVLLTAGSSLQAPEKNLLIRIVQVNRDSEKLSLYFHYTSPPNCPLLSPMLSPSLLVTSLEHTVSDTLSAIF